jgi:hypothetical protein
MIVELPACKTKRFGGSAFEWWTAMVTEGSYGFLPLPGATATNVRAVRYYAP